jgi:hypothetical protein
MNKIILALVLVLVGLLQIFSKYIDVQAQETSLISQSWKLSSVNGSVEAYQAVDPSLLKGKQAIRLTYNLNGLCLSPADASAIVFDQNGWKMASLANYGTNCSTTVQTVTIPLTDFKDPLSGEPLDMNKPLDGSFHVRFWSPTQFMIDLSNATLVDGQTPENQGVTGNGITGITDGDTVKGLMYIGFSADPKTTTSVRFYINTSIKSVENYAPYYLGGDNNGTPIGWDTKQLQDGIHTLTVKHIKNDGTTVIHERSFTVANTTTALTPSPSIFPSPTPVITSPTVSPTIIRPTPTPKSTPLSPISTTSWSIRSMDAMKDTKDAICSQRSDEWIGKWVDKAVEVGANYVAISMPYDNPSCGNAEMYTKRWIQAIRSRGLKVWHRHMPMAFEGIYSVQKSRKDYLTQISTYIKNNPENYVSGDIFTPIPEPQNGGIAGITHCAYGVCQWDNKEAFNKWLRDAITVSRSAFNTIGKSEMKIGYYGFDGFVAWGANNPDWNGILEDATITAMGNITIDHYPELIGTDMATDIAELEARYPGVDIIIGEWGTVTGGDTATTVKESMGALVRPSVKGFNYWQFGPHGAGEQLINDDFSNRSNFAEVKKLYTR